MARRIDIELTSKRDDGAWTWRAAGAREPRGTVDGKLLPPTCSVGDTFKVEVEGFLDGLTITAVIPPKTSRSEPERIEILAPRTGETTLVTTQLARKPRRDDDRRGGDRRDDRRGRDNRGERGDRDRDRDRRGPRSGSSDRSDRGERTGGGDRRRERPAPAPVDTKPKPKRLRPAKAHRSTLLEALPAEQRPIAEQLLQGGIPAVRQAIEKQNEELKAAGKAPISPEPLLEVAEKLRHRAQTAVWRDRADAALASVDDLDLRDLRSVVNAAGDAGRDQDARAVADQLREALINRVEKEQSAWVAEVAENLQEGRVVRALRLSSRPPKAGSPLPGNLAEQLITATNEALTAETGPQRWATVLDALAFSPIRRRVVPASLPEKLPADLRELIAKLASRLPEIAHIFAIDASAAPARPRPPRRKTPDAKAGKPRDGKPRPPKPEKPKSDSKPKPNAEATEPKPKAEAIEAEPTADAQPTAEAAEAPEATNTEPTVDAQATAEGPEATEPEAQRTAETDEPTPTEPEAAAADTEPTADTEATAEVPEADEPEAQPTAETDEPTPTESEAQPTAEAAEPVADAQPAPEADEPTPTEAEAQLAAETAEPEAESKPAADEPTATEPEAPAAEADDGGQGSDEPSEATASA